LERTENHQFEARSNESEDHRRQDQCKPETTNQSDRTTQIGTQHVEGAMAKIDDVAKAINQREAGRHHHQKRGKRQRIGDQSAIIEIDP
jgi:hypothetical protein